MARILERCYKASKRIPIVSSISRFRHCHFQKPFVTQFLKNDDRIHLYANRKYHTNFGSDDAGCIFHIQGSATQLGLGATTASQLNSLCENALEESKLILDNIFSNWDNTKNAGRFVLYSIDEISNLLCSIADPCELIRHVHSSEEWRVVANGVVERISSFISHVNINEELFNLMKQGLAADELKLDREELLVFRHMIESMKHQGLGLPEESRTEYLNLQSEEGAIVFFFSDPNIAKHATTTTFDGFEIQPNAGLYAHLLSNTMDDEMRKRLWHAQQQSDNNTLKQLLKLKEIRSRLAEIRGFPSYADCAQRECMLKSPDEIKKFLKRCALIIKDELQLELKQLEEIKTKIGKTGPLQPWDLEFLMSMDKREYAQYISIDSVMKYFSKIMNFIFEISLEQDHLEGLWDPFVAKFNLIGRLYDDKSETCILGHLYLDLFERPHKANVNAQFTIRCSKDVTNCNNQEIQSQGTCNTFGSITRQIPATAIVCSFSSPDKTVQSAVEAFKASKIDITAAQTLFHELGHTLHTLLSETKLQHLSGNRGGVDFAEFSSHLFELYFAHGIEEICKIEKLSLHATESAKLYLSKYKAIETARMILMAYLDQEFYTSDSIVDDACKYEIPIFTEIDKCNRPLKELLGIPAITNFDHLVHYGGIYYCYLYSRYLDTCACNCIESLLQRFGALLVAVNVQERLGQDYVDFSKRLGLIPLK
ncbi:bifunctional CRIB domain/Peptidase M3A-M3B catalytic domain/Peptidase M3A-M3B/Metallopeptidase [Babesia duncani]|uniref:Bifunctional CRIB domain/Peptidase M3A-M3B catalytic domain/Peptidase M3A-M3B/Metallopeptidase n=1 Tax=Babesia duncani TaxID=323732 RepID=A0AAD9PLV8_9APIC|nr:bifunctional CRIB domain/Peptidase M3A-M3B catalytic domain/Peptidase M3A-M3B/Metallopeptidase [Babesia duncani]